MKQRENALWKLQAAKFALLELHLYLDTHPEDIAAMTAYKKYEAKYTLLCSEFEEKYGALKWLAAPGVEWCKNPWPWDAEVFD